MLIPLSLQVLTTAAASLFAIFSARLLGPYDRGLVVIALVAIQVGAQFGTLGVNQLSRTEAARPGEVFRGDAEAHALGRARPLIRRASSVTAVLAGVAGAVSLRAWQGGERLTVAFLVLIFAICAMVGIILRDTAHGAGRHLTAQYSDLLVWVVALLVLGAGLVVRGERSAALATVALGVGYSCQVCFLRYSGPRLVQAPAFNLSITSFLSNSGQYAMMRVDKFAVGLILGAAAAGLYSVASTIAEVCWIPCLLLAQYGARAAVQNNGDMLRKARFAAVLACVAWAALASVAAPFVINMLFGCEFADAGPLVLPRLISATACGVAYFELAILIAAGAHVKASRLSWGGVVLVGSALAGSGIFGLVAATWVSAVVFVAVAGMALLASPRPVPG